MNISRAQDRFRRPYPTNCNSTLFRQPHQHVLRCRHTIATAGIEPCASNYELETSLAKYCATYVGTFFCPSPACQRIIQEDQRIGVPFWPPLRQCLMVDGGTYEDRWWATLPTTNRSIGRRGTDLAGSSEAPGLGEAAYTRSRPSDESTARSRRIVQPRRIAAPTEVDAQPGGVSTPNEETARRSERTQGDDEETSNDRGLPRRTMSDRENRKSTFTSEDRQRFSPSPEYQPKTEERRKPRHVSRASDASPQEVAIPRPTRRSRSRGRSRVNDQQEQPVQQHSVQQQQPQVVVTESIAARVKRGEHGDEQLPNYSNLEESDPEEFVDVVKNGKVIRRARRKHVKEKYKRK